jgi:geranylgeranyl pyrophosphate synthase
MAPKTLNPTRRELNPVLAAWSERADAVLAQVMATHGAARADRLHEAMRYALLGGGKRLRPLLVYAVGHLFGVAPGRLDPAAAAVEIIHAYSLVHDDLPAMDDDALRRGRPTCHVAFGEAMAILAGDALQALAFEVLAAETGDDVDPATRVAMLRTLGTACGAEGMAGGQALDLMAVGRPLGLDALECMHALKTGALIRAAVRLGALACGRCTDATFAALDRYAHCIGLAFQIKDDLLDVEGETAALGKTAGKDRAATKPTYPAILGVAESHARLASLVAEARSLLDAFGAAAEPLRDIAGFVAGRNA